MELTFITIALLATFIAMMWSYERRLIATEELLRDLILEKDEQFDDHVATAPGFTPVPNPKLALVNDRVFTAAEIEEWN